MTIQEFIRRINQSSSHLQILFIPDIEGAGLYCWVYTDGDASTFYGDSCDNPLGAVASFIEWMNLADVSPEHSEPESPF